MTGEEIRTRFLEHFRSRGHMILESAPLVPVGDPSTLFISAGMQPLQPYYRGLSRPPAPRLASVQKVFRAVDIDEVGRDDRHSTLFEMMGNFAPTGDYFKKHAILWAWELVTEIFNIPVERLRVTVHPEDDSSRSVWRDEVGVRPDWIYSAVDNWWGLATGPCGYDSEIFYDRGPDVGCGEPDCYPDHCDRFLEIWNLVFPEFDRQPDGSLVPLPKPAVDTGSGLERVAMALQGVANPFETDLYGGIMAFIRENSRKRLPDSERVVADHLRAMSFIVAAGVAPSKAGRGYVLRRLIRRAQVHADRLALSRPLADGVDAVVETLGAHHSELAVQRDVIRSTVAAETERFAHTLGQGMELFERAAGRDGRLLAGEDVFRLHDTHGFPLELTRELAEERGLEIDHEGFQALMAQQRERSRGAVKALWSDPRALPTSGFTGYTELETEAPITALRRAGETVQDVAEGDEVEVYLERTPFYAESGGQVGDTGLVTGPSGSVRIEDTLKPAEGVAAHLGTVVTGRLAVGETVRASVDANRRHQIARHHSATHLLHQALCELLGVDNAQRGSWVGPDHTTFDFPLDRALSETELQTLGSRVREKVRQALPLKVSEMDRAEAEAGGAKHLFEEKYGDRVRVVCFGDWTCELCGGTHVANTADVGTTLILSESSIGSGLRRIDLAAGDAADAVVETRLGAMRSLAQALGVPSEAVSGRVSELRHQLREAERQIEKLKDDLRVAQVKGRPSVQVRQARVGLVTEEVRVAGMPDLRAYADRYMESIGSGVVAVTGDGSFVVKLSRDLDEAFDARQYAPYFGQGGGNRLLVQGKLTVSPAEAFNRLEAALQ
jgi:alanyl-tRNA synthetase